MPKRVCFLFATLLKGWKNSLIDLPAAVPLTIAFTSSVQKEGKSFLSYHLAYYYSCIGKKVVLIEMDPHANPFTDEQQPVPLENYLRGNVEKEAIILAGRPDRIRIGSAQPFMKELLKTQQMAALMQYLKQSYDRSGCAPSQL